METSLRLLLVLLTSAVISACGGSGGDEGTPVTPEKPKDTRYLTSPEELTTTELNQAYQQHADSLYTGSTAQAKINLANSQQFLSYMTGDETLYPPYISVEDITYHINNNSANTEVIEYSCEQAGSVSITGAFDENQTGLFDVNFNNCQDYYEPMYDGKAYFNVTSNKDNAYKVNLYFAEIEATRDGQQFTISGQTRSENEYDDNSGVYKYEHEFYVTYQFPNKTLKDHRTIEYQTGNNYLEAYKVTSSLLDSELGQANYTYLDSYSSINGSQQSITLEGDITSQIEFLNNFYIKYSEDTNNDGSPDVGYHFSSIWNFLDSQTDGVELIAYDELTFPPVVHIPSLYAYNATTKTELEASYPYYYDDDTPQEELSSSYNWYINGELVENVNGNILPAYIAVSGDKVQVSLVVSDGVNTIESELSYEIIIGDSPAEFIISNLPSIVDNGDTAIFNAVFTDPDIGAGSEQAAVLISGPEGATINEQGVVTWLANETSMFPQLSVNFIFANTLAEDAEKHEASIKVTSTGAMPIARSGIEIPSVNHSITIGDFTGDGNNEVLSTDSQHSIFLLSHQDEQYSQSWMYPFAIGEQSNIKQVIGHNIDTDATLEILVATNQGISVINGLEKMATAIWETDGYVQAFALTGDGEDTIAAVITSSSSYSSGAKQLQVFAINSPTTLLLDTAIESDSNEVIFANVDDDSQIELVINSGKVYDGATWENQWFKGSGFGEHYVTAADLTGDNIAEIIGADNWGAITVFSANTKTELASFENGNTCTLQTLSVADASTDKVIVGDCQWGSITAYDLQAGALVSAWSLDMQAHGSKSLAVGDSDNDGDVELHWGTGGSSSGEDIFVVANVESEVAIQWQNTNPSQLDSYASAGWANVEPNEEQAIFFIPGTNSGYDGSAIVSMELNGNYNVSEEISSNWDNSRYAAVTDFNNDGYGDIFLPSAKTYNGGFSALQINDLTSFWSYEGDYDDNIGVIDAYDVNQDGFDDALYINSGTLTVIDINNEVSLGSINIADNYYGSDFAVTTLDEQSVIAISTSSNVQLWIKSGSSYSNKSEIEVYCTRINFINIDEDDELELACASQRNSYSSYNNNSSIIIYEIENEALVEKSKTELSYQLLDFIADSSAEYNQGFFATAKKSNSSYSSDDSYILVKISNSGEIILESPDLIGQPTHRGLKMKYSAEEGSKFMLSTSEAMYLFND